MESTSKTHQGERAESWPALPFEVWRDTCEVLHMWTQIVGKVRMELSPFQSTYEAGAKLAQWDRDAIERRIT
jgi:uncharacterized protein DUF5996